MEISRSFVSRKRPATWVFWPVVCVSFSYFHIPLIQKKYIQRKLCGDTEDRPLTGAALPAASLRSELRFLFNTF